MKITTWAAIVAAGAALAGSAAAQMAPEATMQPIPNPSEAGAGMHHHMMSKHHMMWKHHMMAKHHMMSKHHMDKMKTMKKMKAEAAEPTAPK